MTPQLFRAELFKTSGHYDEFHDDMFWFEGDEGEELGVKPMNCPGHCRVFCSGKRSYRELPLRFAEFSRLHRNERSGTLTGLSRVRSMAQDDAHIYCEPEQVPAEIERFFAMTAEVYRDSGPLGREGLRLDAAREVHRRARGLGSRRAAADRRVKSARLRVRDQAGRGRLLRAEGRVRLRGRARPRLDALDDPGRHGDARPLRPALHRSRRPGAPARRCCTVRCSARSSASSRSTSSTPAATSRSGSRRCRSSCCRSPSGTRTTPPRCTPRCVARGVRAELDARNEKLNLKIREAELAKIPVMLVVGDQEVANGTVTPRRRQPPRAARPGRSPSTAS